MHCPDSTKDRAPMSHTNFLSDFVDLEPFAADVARNPRTVRRWLNQPDGLPFTRIGNRILIHVPTAREWLMKRMKRHNPRRRGRQAAALADRHTGAA
jgi:hypothetical protein